MVIPKILKTNLMSGVDLETEVSLIGGSNQGRKTLEKKIFECVVYCLR